VCGFASFEGALADEVGQHLVHRTDDVRQKASGGGGGVDALLEHHQVEAALIEQCGAELATVEGITSQPVFTPAAPVCALDDRDDPRCPRCNGKTIIDAGCGEALVIGQHDIGVQQLTMQLNIRSRQVRRTLDFSLDPPANFE
jgi:hypothetical protein